MMPCIDHRPLQSDRPRRRRGSASKAGRAFLAAVCVVVGFGTLARAQPGGVLKDVAFDQHLDTQIPLTLPFKDGEGRDVQLSDYFGKRPVFLVMGYKNCPLLCSQVLGELTRSLRPLDASVGKDFDILSVSIDPKESPEQADAQRRIYLKRYNRPGSESGWNALVGSQESIQQLARAIGFKYEFSPRTGKYAHAAGFVLLTPAGRISRYFFGVEYPARELKYAIAQATESKIGSPINKLILYCYEYDPTTGKYTFAIMNTIRVFGVATALALGTFFVVMVRRDRRMARATRAATPEHPPGPATL
ncbi:SCO family protein [Tundrisphaera lichenicola]|uniref:SCO family protein n=1 Tax=Tundrisphaera lichenicola TaxID=2029860 RepID=UPI003EBB21C7